MKCTVLGALVLVVQIPAAFSQNHPELDWQELETAHFRIFYHQGLERAGARAAEIAEAAYGPVTQLYGYEPGEKVRIVLKDYDDYANGAAFFYHDTIEIWTTSLDHDVDLRGTSDWLSNVITHEFVHIVSLGASRKAPQRWPAFYLQYFGYQREENRPDVLIGYPDVLASYPVLGTIVAMWFAEGVAQYQVEGARHDRWDSHRDMILRTAVLNDALLSFDEMGVFAKKGFGNEYVYDHGYGLVRYIARTYGDEKLAQICRAISGWSEMEINGAIQEVLGVSAEELYRSWRKSMQHRYQKQVADLGELHQGEAIGDQGFSNIRPAYSPDGRYLAYLSTQKRHYGPHLLVLRDMESGEEKVLYGGVVSSVSWSPDSRRLLFVMKSKGDKYGSRQADIYQYDLDSGEVGIFSRVLWTVPAMVSGHAPESPKIRRLSHGLRALYPAYSPDGEWIVFVHNQGSSNNLGLMKADGSQVHYLTDFSDGTQLYTPQWSPDGRSLVCSITQEGQRDIALLGVAREKTQQLAATMPLAAASQARLEVLVATPATDRDPVWSADGKEVVFASDISGLFNLYAIQIETRQVQRLTNLVGGGLSPTLDPEGKVAFAAYGEKGYEIRQINRERAAAAELPMRPGVDFGDHFISSPNTPKDALKAQPYGIDFLKTSLMPRLMLDEGRFKGGMYLSAGDVLGRQAIFAGAALAPTNRDRDLFLIYQYRKWRPTLFLEFFHQRRHSARGDSSEAKDFIVTGMNFVLNQVSVGLRSKLGKDSELDLSMTYDRYDTSIWGDAFQPRRDGSIGFERVPVKPFGYTYLNGFDLGLTYRYESVARRRDRDINPRQGRRIYFRYDRMFNKFIEGFDEQNTSFLQEEFLNLSYNQFTLDWSEYIGLPCNNTLGLRLYSGWIDSKKVDDKEVVNDFFDYHIGGLQYMKGYTFFSLEGRKALMGQTTLRFPILPDVRKRFLHLYFDKVYGALYGDMGKAWDDKWDDLDPNFGRKGPLRDLGGQLRFDLISYYSMPTRVQMDLAYGIDEVEYKSPWKFYLAVLFGYL